MTTITCTGCGGERIMTQDQIDVPENGLCALELDSCPSDQNLLLEEALNALERVAIGYTKDWLRADHNWAKQIHEELNKMCEAVGIYTPTPYHQTSGTRPAENNNKEE